MLNQTDEKDAPQARWIPLKLRSLLGLQFYYRFDYRDDLQALVLSVRIEQGDWTLKYGMSRQELGLAWNDDNQAEQRLKAFAEAELRKDLFLFYKAKKVPCSLSRIVWIDSRGRAIP